MVCVCESEFVASGIISFSSSCSAPCLHKKKKKGYIHRSLIGAEEIDICMISTYMAEKESHRMEELHKMVHEAKGVLELVVSSLALLSLSLSLF